MLVERLSKLRTQVTDAMRDNAHSPEWIMLPIRHSLREVNEALSIASANTDVTLDAIMTVMGRAELALDTLSAWRTDLESRPTGRIPRVG